MGKHLKKFVVGLVGSSTVIALSTVYFWVLYFVCTSIWSGLSNLVR